MVHVGPSTPNLDCSVWRASEEPRFPLSWVESTRWGKPKCGKLSNLEASWGFPLILKTSQVLLKHTSSVEYHADISQVRKQVSSVLRFCNKHSWRYFERSTKIEAVKTPGKVIPLHAPHGPAASLLMLSSSRRLQITPIVQSMRLNWNIHWVFTGVPQCCSKVLDWKGCAL